jgi:2-polyprenyl-3-methyl-5-hydroxy-6-metoxy-1,4-benzoquinol methylase
MNGSRLTAAAKALLWKALGRDALTLNPGWRILGQGQDFMLVGRPWLPREQSVLPVAYNYHVLPAGNLRYFVFGHGTGRLYYHLYSPSQTEIGSVSLDIELPYKLEVCVKRDEILANNRRFSAVGLDLLSPPSPELASELTFTDGSGRRAWRRTQHRVRYPLGEVDREYYSGKHYADYQAEDRRQFHDNVLRAIERFHPLAGRSLDVGCATGGLVQAALHAGLDAYGFDYSDWAIEKARQVVGHRCWRLDLDRASGNEIGHGYDIVTINAVLEHVKDPKGALRKVHAACATGAVVYITTLNADSMLARVAREDWAGHTDYSHHSPWISWSWLVETAQEIGFTVKSLETSTCWLENPLDPVWRSMHELFSTQPLSCLLAEGLGDIVEIILES